MLRSCFLPLYAVLLAAVFAHPIGQVQAQTFLDRQTADSVRIACYNVHFDDLFLDEHFPGELMRFIDAVDADVWNFQEAFETSANELRIIFDSLAPLPGGESWKTHKGRNQIIVSRYPLSMQLTDVPGGTRGIAMAMVDLPDEVFSNDMYILNNHFPCCDGGEQQRRFEAERIIDWIEDAQTPGGTIDLPIDTGILVLGDLNIVNGPTALNTLLHGYGGFAPDWDGTSITDAHPLHNFFGPADWTWRNDQSPFDPGILDYVLYTDSVLTADHSFVLNPSDMTSSHLQQSGLMATDFMRNKDNPQLNDFDHIPLVVDFIPVSVTNTVAADQFTIIRGRQVFGSLADVADSDDSYLEFNPGLTLSPAEPPVWIEFETALSDDTPTSLILTVESHVNTGGLNHTLELYNFDTGNYEIFSNAAATLKDTVLEITVNEEVSRFVESGTAVVRCRTAWKGAGPVGLYPWTVSFDEVSWTATH